MKKIWKLNTPADEVRINDLSKSAGINRFVAAVLYNRGITTTEDMINFINPKLKFLHSPRNMKDMDKGTDVILNAIKKKKKIVIYGDYDCDGVTSTSIMFKGLSRCGADVSYHIPDRIEEGYGMNSETVKELAEKGFQVILTCDNGISCIDQVDLAKSLGLEVVVTDHHEVPHKQNEDGERMDIIPGADAVINPKRQDCEYPFKDLCGAGVAFKFIHTLYVKLGIDSKELYEFIELAAIGTICDVVNLTDENRVIVSMGLKMLNETKNIGLKALIKASGLDGKKIKAYNIGFHLGPAINATGRLDSARLSVELLLTKDESRAEELARQLRSFNTERQAMTDSALEDVLTQIENSSLKNHKVIVVYQEDLHESLAGIVAGRIREKYNRPALVITSARDKAKGSGRSIDEYDMFEEILRCRDLLLAAGGHPMAAGFSLPEENISEFRKRLNELCCLSDEDLTLKILTDGKLELQDITFDLAEGLEKLEPFGKGNKEPVFMAENLYIDRIFLMGQNRDSFRLMCRDSSGASIQAVRFFDVDTLKAEIRDAFGEERVNEIIEDPRCVNLRMDILFKLSVNVWNNSKTIQLGIVDYRICI